MEELGVNLWQIEDDQFKVVVMEGFFVGKIIFFMGSFQQMSCKEVQEKVVVVGVKNISVVSGNFNILVVGEKVGFKLKKVQVFGIVEIMMEEEFLMKIG